MLQKEFQYYLDNQNELVKKYNNRVIVVSDNHVIGDYDNDRQALFESIENGYKPGTFLIQKCSPGNKDYTLTFHSRVAFA
ncbi:MAG: hypothetical protein LBN95_04930 [Prevotellaceae bacterium]|jgi:hypothetical protein|nr:hypothetical protein [Prevotellaceae bacterium]